MTIPIFVPFLHFVSLLFWKAPPDVDECITGKWRSQLQRSFITKFVPVRTDFFTDVLRSVDLVRSGPVRSPSHGLHHLPGPVPGGLGPVYLHELPGAPETSDGERGGEPAAQRADLRDPQAAGGAAQGGSQNGFGTGPWPGFRTFTSRAQIKNINIS